MKKFNKFICCFITVTFVLIYSAKSQMLKGPYIAKIDSLHHVILIFKSDSTVIRRNFNATGEVKPSDVGKFSVNNRQLILTWPDKTEKHLFKIIYSDSFELTPVDRNRKDAKRVFRFSKIVDEEVSN